MGKNYSREFKEEVCKQIVENGETAPNVCLELDLKENTVYSWLKSYRERGGKPFVGSGNIKPEEVDFKRLQKENRELKEEVEILKKAAAYFARSVR